MTHILKLATLLAFLVIGSAVFLTDTAQGKLTAGSSSALASPRSLYIQNCASCHGANGKALTPRGRKLEAADLTSDDVRSMGTARIARAIKNGRPGMPAFGKKLTPKQISSIAAYVRSL